MSTPQSHQPDHEPSHEPVEPEDNKVKPANTAEVPIKSLNVDFKVELEWDDLSYTVDGKECISHLSGVAIPSRTLAVMGASGSGKTVFIKSLCDQLITDSSHVLSGSRMLNCQDYKSEHRKLMGYVTQEDIVFPTSSPSDAFRFSLRCRRGFDLEETQQRVDAMLKELHLERARDTLFGLAGLILGLSGGERKRTSIGIELICDPKIMLLDEPTSGLDSVTACNVIAHLQETARRGRTIIFTIHQPTADTVKHFDDLLLLWKGKAVYHGAMANAVTYFKSIGHVCPSDYTPTDYFMTLVQEDDLASKLVDEWGSFCKSNVTPTMYIQTKQDNDQLAATKRDTQNFLDDYVQQFRSPYAMQFQELFMRNWRNVYRNYQYIIASLAQALFFGALAGAIFHNLKDDIEGVFDRKGFLFMVANSLVVSTAMMTINLLPAEKAVFVREELASSYSPAVYFVAKALAELPLQVLSYTLQAIILYFASQLAQDAGRFFIFYFVTILVSQVGVGIGFAISVWSPTYELATGFVPVVTLPMLLAGGVLATTDRLRPYWYWMEKISVIRYGYVLMAKNEFESLDHISCDVSKYGALFCSRQVTNGTQVIEEIGFTDFQHEKWAMWVSLFAMFGFVRLLAITALYRISGAKS